MIPERPTNPSREQIKSQFLTKLTEVQGWLQQEGIPFRIIGSLALNAYTGYPINFVREERHGYQMVPDIDLIIPRSELRRVEAFRKTLLEGSFPVHLELLSTTSHIDLRPNEEYSYLTHQRLQVPIKTDLWEPVVREIEGVPIVTVPPLTLFHTYVVCGGTIRHSDWPKVLTLGRYIRSEANDFPGSEIAYTPVHRFLRERKEEYPLDVKLMWFAQTQVPKFPPFIYKQLWDKLVPVTQWYYRLNRRGRERQ